MSEEREAAVSGELKLIASEPLSCASYHLCKLKNYSELEKLKKKKLKEIFFRQSDYQLY